VREPDELVTGVTLPAPRPGMHGAYVKLRVRQSIDFPVLSVAAGAVLGEGRRVEDLFLAVGQIASQPRVVKGAADTARDGFWTRTWPPSWASSLTPSATSSRPSTWTRPGAARCCRSTCGGRWPRSGRRPSPRRDARRYRTPSTTTRVERSSPPARRRTK